MAGERRAQRVDELDGVERRVAAGDDRGDLPAAQTQGGGRRALGHAEQPVAVASCSGAGSRSRTNSAGAPRRAMRFEKAFARRALGSWCRASGTRAKRPSLGATAQVWRSVMGRSAACPSAACAATMRSAASSKDSSTSSQWGRMSGAVERGGGRVLPVMVLVPLFMGMVTSGALQRSPGMENGGDVSRVRCAGRGQGRRGLRRGGEPRTTAECDAQTASRDDYRAPPRSDQPATAV